MYPEVGQSLIIQNTAYNFVDHPSAPKMVYAQEGRKAIVFQIRDESGKSYALKVFKSSYRNKTIEVVSKKLAEFSNLPGLSIANRTVITHDGNSKLINRYPDLEYSILMPWIEGITWVEFIQSKKQLSQEKSTALAEALIHVLKSLEENKLAHTDISGSNVIINPQLNKVELLGVEGMFGISFPKPAFLHRGSWGYSRQNTENLWCPEGDRFAGAILLVEMMCWRESLIREASSDESYFEPEEIGKKSSKYTLMLSVLETISPRLSKLFSQVWEASTLSRNPKFTEWKSAFSQLNKGG